MIPSYYAKKLQIMSKNPSEIYGKDRKGKEISIKLACYREVDHFINLLRNRPDRRGTVVESIDFTNYKALPMDPINCFEQEQTDYSKYDELVEALDKDNRISFLASDNKSLINKMVDYTSNTLDIFVIGKIDLNKIDKLKSLSAG